MNNLTREYGRWIGSMKWNYIITIRKHYKFRRKSVRKLIDKIGNEVKKSKLINSIFIVGERDVDDWSNFHTHILIQTDMDQNKDLQTFINSISGKKDSKYIEPVLDEKSVGFYLTKFLDRDVEYDIYFKGE